MKRTDLLGMLTSLPVGNHIVAFHLGKGLWSQRKAHADGTLLRQVGEQVGVFGGDGGCGKRVPT
jgi:hypothetical protein